MLAGTASSTAMLARGEIRSCHGETLQSTEANAIADALAEKTVEARRAMRGMIVARADVLVAGVRILRAIVRWARVERFVVSEGGARFGLLREALGV
jgi:exopolyphosphatase/pppGpp-phosphohydrolase